MQSAPIAPENDETTQAAGVDAESTHAALGADPLLNDELLIEEISIDGMCGVY